MDLIVDINAKKSRRNRYAKYGKNLYKIRCHRFVPEKDMCEPMHHFPRSKIIDFYQKQKQLIPSEIESTYGKLRQTGNAPKPMFTKPNKVVVENILQT